MDLDRIEALARLMRENGLAELELEEGGARLALRLAGVVAPAPAPAPAAAASAPAPATPAVAAAPAEAGALVKAPMVGTFYRSAKPGAPPFVDVGDKVRKGQVLCILEAMKLMNEIESDAEGTVAAILVDNGRPVQFGQPLFRIV
jgi:acetyl-CoA carboxylase biotin carboxyl carrier protein